MKKLFLMLALTGLVGAAGVNTAAAINHTKTTTFLTGEEKNKKEKKKDACCKDRDKKNCKEGEKKCCSSHTKEGKTTSNETKTEDKKAVEQK